MWISSFTIKLAKVINSFANETSFEHLREVLRESYGSRTIQQGCWMIFIKDGLFRDGIARQIRYRDNP